MPAAANRRSGLGRLADLSARKLQKYYPKWSHLRGAYVLVLRSLYQTVVGASKNPCTLAGVRRSTFGSRFMYMYNLQIAKSAVFLHSVKLVQVVDIIS